MKVFNTVKRRLDANRTDRLWMGAHGSGLWIALLLSCLLAGFGEISGPMLTAGVGGQAMGSKHPTPTPVEVGIGLEPAQATPSAGTEMRPAVQMRTANVSPLASDREAEPAPGEPIRLALPLILNGAPAPMPEPADSAAAQAAIIRRLIQARLTPASTATPMPQPTATPASVPTSTPVPAAGPTPDGTVRTVQIPILMYHYLSVPPVDADIYRLDLSVTPELFAAQLDRLQAEGYTTIGLDLLVRHLAQGAPLPDRPVILTFDDGYRDNYENALPLLVERGMTATFFVVTDFIDQQLPTYLTWNMVREMHGAGMSIGSHGRNHVSLKNQDRDYLIWQALGSAETLEYELGERPRFISYPAGEYDPLTIGIFHSADYWAGLTTQQGATHSGDSLFELRRVRVRGTTDPGELLRLVRLDW